MDGAAANGFAVRGHLLLDEAWTLAACPCHPSRKARASDAAVRRRERALASHGDNGAVMGRCNSPGRKRWWGAPGRTLPFVLNHIAAGDQPRLTMPPPRMWTPRRGLSASSSGNSSSSGARSAPVRAAPLLNSGRRAPDRSAPARRLVRPKTEPAPEWQAEYAPPEWQEAADPGEQEEEWAGQRAAEEASFNTVQPAEDDFAVDWSLRDFTAAEIEKQRRILEEVERERERAAAPPPAVARRPRIPPPPEPKPVVFIKLDPSDSEDEDDEVIRRTLLASKWSGGDQAGPSKPPGAPSDDDDDDGDAGDYSQAIYNSLGIN